MKRSTLVILLALMVILLGLIAYTAVMFFGNGTVQTCCPFVSGGRQSFQNERGTGRGFGMMGPGQMGHGMMGSMNIFIENEHDLLVHMIPHHEEAVAKAIYLRENTEREAIRDFAEDIIRIQTAEIEQMTLYLETWYPDQEHHVDYQPMMRELEGLRGDTLDRAFLNDMIPHHMTAVMMSQQLLVQNLAEHEEVAVLAQSIRNSQRDEIHMMMNWLANWNSSAPLTDTRSWKALIWVGVLTLSVIIALVILLVFALHSGKLSAGPSSNQAQEILKKRYVMGEITREDFLNSYEELKK
jgi:uncharacterized protein (DUF305 family)/flagellar basal body-associated protein FliL